MAGIAGIAFGMRLWPVLTGGGLYGRGNYDDGVYYTAAAGFVHGLMPYRDFLLLHPPGIVLALAPFAELARLVGDPTALAAARVAFMGIGTVNAILVAVVLRRLGPAAAGTGGLLYAVFFPAVYVEHSTLLEPLATTCLLGAVALAIGARDGGRAVPARLATAGVLLGLAASLKIWGVVPALAMIGWALLAVGWRRALVLLAGVAAGTTAVCLPFFAAAPDRMWRLVVLAQLGRPRTDASWWDRAVTIAGLTPFPVPASPQRWWLAVAAVVVAACCLAAFRSSVGRLGVLLLAATVAMLFSTPSWFLHYGAVAAAPVAVVVGAAAGWLATKVQNRAAGALLGVVGVVVLALYGQAVLARPFGHAFPIAALARPVASARTCVTADDPIALIELNVLRRNLDRGCALVADLGGYNYALQVGAGRFHSRARNPQWQRVAVDYLRGGDVAVVGLRFHRGSGFTKATAKTVKSWPLLGTAGAVTVRRPTAYRSVR